MKDNPVESKVCFKVQTDRFFFRVMYANLGNVATHDLAMRFPHWNAFFASRCIFECGIISWAGTDPHWRLGCALKLNANLRNVIIINLGYILRMHCIFYVVGSEITSYKLSNNCKRTKNQKKWSWLWSCLNLEIFVNAKQLHFSFPNCFIWESGT